MPRHSDRVRVDIGALVTEIELGCIDTFHIDRVEVDTCLVTKIGLG